MSGEFEPRCLVVACQQDWDLINQALNARDISRWPVRGVDVDHGPTPKRPPVVVDALSLGSR